MTRRATNDWEGEVDARLGSDEDRLIGGWISGPIIKDNLYFLASASYESWDGEWKNNLQDGAAAGYDPSNPLVTPPDPAGGYAYTAPFPPVSDLNFVNPPTRADHSNMGGEETKDLMLKLTWTPTETTEINFKYAYTEGDDDHFSSLAPPPGTQQANCFLPGQPGTVPDTPGAFCGVLDPTGYEDRVNIPDLEDGILASTFNNPILGPEQRYAEPREAGTRRETDRFLLDFRQAFGDWDLTGRFAYNEDLFNQVYDLDHTQVRVLAGLFNFEQIAEQEDYAIELRLSTPVDNRLRGSVGVYYYDFDRSSRVRSSVGPYVALGAEFECPRLDNNPVCAGPGPYPVTTDFPPPNLFTTENTAIFGLAEWDITDQLTFAVEARWAEDKKTIRGGNSSFDETSTDDVTPRFTLRYQATDDLMVYGQIAKGNKPADFNDNCYRYDLNRSATDTCRQEDLNLVKEEEQWTYEAGFKSAWFDRRATVNMSAFYIDWTNQAFFTTSCTTDTIGGTELCSTLRRNAGSTEITGLEFESNWIVSENLYLIVNYGYQKGEFQEGTSPLLEALTGDGNIAGKQVPTAPEHSAVFSGVVTAPISPSLEGFLRSDVIFESEQWVQASNLNEIDKRQLVNLRLGVQTENLTITGYVRNLLDDDAPRGALDFFDFGQPLSNGEAPKLWTLNPQRGRNYGIELSWRFGAQ